MKIPQYDSFITEAEIKSIMGSRYLGDNVVLCGYCLQEELEFTDIFQDYKCNACKEAEQESYNDPLDFKGGV